KPSPKHEIGRIDNDGPYSPENCKWVTHVEQMANTRETQLVTAYDHTLPTRAWARAAGLSLSVLQNRLKRGWSPEDAIGRPPAGSSMAAAARRYGFPLNNVQHRLLGDGTIVASSAGTKGNLLDVKD